MIPSTLAAEVSGALRDFLSTGFYEVADALPATESGAGPSSDGDGTGSEQPEVDSERAHERREREPDRPGRREAPDAQSGGHGGTRVGPVHRIRYADDLKPDEDSVHLPLIQCRECHATAWGCVKHAGEQRVNQNLRAFYNRFFLRDVDVNYLFPLSPDEPPPQNVPGRELNICGRCGCLAGHDAEACPGCGQDHLTRVFRPEVVVSKGAGKHTRPQLSRNCPYCGAREALIIVGARTTSLLSTALAQLFASRHNDDRKVIAFSDNVQDAAHRGSFFAARTWRNGLRAAIAQVVEKNDGIALADLPDRWRGRTPRVFPGRSSTSSRGTETTCSRSSFGHSRHVPGQRVASTTRRADTSPSSFTVPIPKPRCACVS